MMDLTVRKGMSSRDSPIVTRARKTATQKIPMPKKKAKRHNVDKTKTGKDPQPTLYPSENARLRNQVQVLTEENALLRVQLKEALANKTTFQIGKSKKRSKPDSDITESGSTDSNTSSSEEEIKGKEKKEVQEEKI